ncbi:MAG: SDR family oxidoreductase [Methylophilus sp.]|nr:SDR family oxidoreductase [Methylophilus sp.]
MAKILLVGCGKLGMAVALNLCRAGHEVVGVRKSAQALPMGMHTLQADVTQADSLTCLKMLYPQVVIYCIAATAQNDENYFQHYVLGLKNVLESQQNNKQLEHVFFVSSTRVYGQNTQEIVDEKTPVIPSDFGGERLLEAERVLSSLSCAYTVLRLSGIYGAGRLHLINLARDQSRWPAQNHWSNRIHQDDAAAFIEHLIRMHVHQQGLASCYLVTDDLPTQQYEVLTWLAQQMHLDVAQRPVPEVLHVKRLSNRLMRETGFVLQYPSYQQGYAAILATLS